MEGGRQGRSLRGSESDSFLCDVFSFIFHDVCLCVCVCGLPVQVLPWRLSVVLVSPVSLSLSPIQDSGHNTDRIIRASVVFFLL